MDTLLIIALILALLGCAGRMLQGLTGRRRLWFPGDGPSPLSNLQEERTQLLRELRYRGRLHERGELSAEDYQRVRAEIAADIDALDTQLAAAKQAEHQARTSLGASGKGGATLLVLLASLWFASTASAQSTGAVELQVSGINDTAGLEVVVLGLHSGCAPFNECTQAEWTPWFERHSSNPNMSRTSTALLNFRTPDLRGRSVTDSTGRARVEGLPTGERLALALRYAGTWWPVLEEQFLSADAPNASVTLALTPVHSDAGQISIENWNLSASGAPRKRGVRWNSIDVHESIVIANTSTTHAYLPDQSEPWLRLTVLAPPDLPPTEMVHPMMRSEWALHYALIGGSDRIAPISERMLTEAEQAALHPYLPWSFGAGWNDPNAHATGTTTMTAFSQPGAKWSPLKAHALASEGNTLIGAGDIWLRPAADGAQAIEILVGKPIPAGGRVRLRVFQRPGYLVEAPRPLALQRGPLPCDVRAMRVSMDSYLGLTGSGQLSDLTRSPGTDGTLQFDLPAPGVDSPALLAGQPFGFAFTLTDILLGMVRNLAEAQAQEPQAQPPLGTTMPAEEATLQVQNLLFLLAALAGLASLVFATWTLSRRAAAAPHTKSTASAEIVAELKALEADLEAKRISQREFQRMQTILHYRLTEACLQEHSSAESRHAGA